MMQRSTKGASKQRRDCINTEINEIREYLPLNESVKRRLSQLQIMALCKAYIGKSNCFDNHAAQVNGYQQTNLLESFDFSQALPGFLLVTSLDGKFIYISENVTEYLGHSMVDLMTQAETIYDIIDSIHHPRIRDFIMTNRFHYDIITSSMDSSMDELVMTCRMNLAKLFRRNNVFDRQKVVKLVGRLIWPDGELNLTEPVFVICCSTLPNGFLSDHAPPVIDTMTFYTNHLLDMKFINIDHNGEYHFGYDGASLQGQSWYQYMHPADVDEAAKNHLELSQGGYDATKSFCIRMQTRYGHFVWLHVIMKLGSALYNNSGNIETTPQHIMCLNHVISEQEARDIRNQAAWEESVELQPSLIDIMADGVNSSLPTVVVGSEFFDQSQTAGQFDKNGELTHEQLMMKIRAKTQQNRNKRAKYDSQEISHVENVFDPRSVASNVVQSSIQHPSMTVNHVLCGATSMSSGFIPQPVQASNIAVQLGKNFNLDQSQSFLKSPLTPPYSDSESSRDWVDIPRVVQSSTPPYSPSSSVSHLEEMPSSNIDDFSFFDCSLPMNEKPVLSVAPVLEATSFISNNGANPMRNSQARFGKPALAKAPRSGCIMIDSLPVLDQGFVAAYLLDVEHPDILNSANTKIVNSVQVPQIGFQQSDAHVGLQHLEQQELFKTHETQMIDENAAMFSQSSSYDGNFMEILNSSTMMETIIMMSASDLLLAS